MPRKSNHTVAYLREARPASLFREKKQTIIKQAQTIEARTHHLRRPWSAPVVVCGEGDRRRGMLAMSEPVGRKVYSSFLDAVGDIPDGATVFVDGFGGPGGMPHFLILALWEHGATGLTLISNTAGITMTAGFGAPGGVRYIDQSILIEKGLVKKVVASFPVAGNPSRVDGVRAGVPGGPG